MSIEHLIIDYGYLILFFGVMLEGETFLILASYLAHRGYLSLPAVIGVAFLGTFLADQLFFRLGRMKGGALLARLPSLNPAAQRARSLIERYNLILVLGFRFVYGIRTITPFVLGLADFSPGRFLVFNFTGGAIWSITLGLAGYAFGHALEILLTDVRRYEMRVAAVVLIAGVGYAVIRWLIAIRRHNPAAE
ncbi:MAG: DedA family protein [Blastocatellales bacterium]